MKGLTRRDFLRGGFLRADGRAEEPAEAGGVPSPGGEAGPLDPGGYRTIGRLADFPVGTVRLLAEVGLEIESLPEGLRARSLREDGGHRALAAGPAGELTANPEEPWPSGWVFSALTNGPRGLDDGWEEGI